MHRKQVAEFEPQANKSFSVQQFFKNAAEVWASSPHLRSKSNCTMKPNKNLRENRKNRNCLQNQKVVMKDKVSGAIAIPRQAGDVPQPCRTGFGWYSQKNFSQGKRSSASGKRGFHPCFCLRLIIGNQIEKFICLWLVLFQPTSKRFPFLPL